MSTESITPLRQRMIEDMNARKLCAGTQTGHIRSCKRFASFLKRSLDTATAEDIRRFQLHLSETSASICNRNRIMTGLRFLFRVTLRRLDLAAEIIDRHQCERWIEQVFRLGPDILPQKHAPAKRLVATLQRRRKVHDIIGSLELKPFFDREITPPQPHNHRYRRPQNRGRALGIQFDRVIFLICGGR